MVGPSPLPPIVQQLSQTNLDLGAAILWSWVCTVLIVEPRYRHSANKQLTITTFHHVNCKSLFNVYFDLLNWAHVPSGHIQRRVLWLILQEATRGQLGCLGFTYRSCHVVHLYIVGTVLVATLVQTEISILRYVLALFWANTPILAC